MRAQVTWAAVLLRGLGGCGNKRALGRDGGGAGGASGASGAGGKAGSGALGGTSGGTGAAGSGSGARCAPAEGVSS